ncbi:Photosystem II reaction center W protein [Hibiscus syriacus]|uniref:PSII 6.1 kDa protein n=1 Tax=Hibiscus syriacus TaxID=106335 RepID=A0A6A3CRM7_HIBSY|nr:photosystem II reaction center W protein, chloroplastic-like [Hibiscus syriacus]KAE8729881.1 Photosystem II reaction center W protein [Hibiscus syriacus]
METISATPSIITAAVATRPLPRLESPVAIGKFIWAAKDGKEREVMCSAEEKGCGEGKGSGMGMSASLLAAACAATMSSPRAMALVDERMSTDFSNNILGWILFGAFGLIWALYFVYTSSLEMRSLDCPSSLSPIDFLSVLFIAHVYLYHV